MKKLLSLLIAAFGCSTLAERSAPWETLFDGSSLAHFQAKGGGAITKGWKIEDGLLYRFEKGGDIETKKTYRDFEFTFEWKVAPGSNSGIKYRHASYNAGVNGPEYQILDDAEHGNGKNPYTSAATMYLLAKRLTNDPVKPAGEWNTGKILAKGSKIEHWLNGVKVVDIDVSTDAFEKQKNATKFKKYKKYGQLEGSIMLQDHNDPVWYRNLRIRTL